MCSNAFDAIKPYIADEKNPESALAEMFKKDLGVDINPQALRMFIRWRFDRLSPLAHKIHRAGE